MATAENPNVGVFEVVKSHYISRNGKDLPEPKAKFRKGDKVSMIVKEGDTTIRKNFVVDEKGVQSDRYVYRLSVKDKDTQQEVSYDGGTYFAEGKLERER